MVIDNNLESNEIQIQQGREKWLEAVRAKDLKRLMTFYSPEIVLFDLTPPLQLLGENSYIKNWKECFEMIDGLIDYEIRDQDITASSDVAFSHSLTRMKAKTKTGHELKTWFRVTVGFRKINGKWLITHEHISVPFDPTSRQASLDLKPEE
ncbi:MAG: nuclear transport factor 2 family protein [Bacteriovorax sp.]|nr:nuclear transport factor 2 family protein [Bacteriovorax sp.]